MVTGRSAIGSGSWCAWLTTPWYAAPGTQLWTSPRVASSHVDDPAPHCPICTAGSSGARLSRGCLGRAEEAGPRCIARKVLRRGTMEETAYFLALTIGRGRSAIVLTGAMRHHGLDGYDGLANLRAALITARAPGLADAGPVVVMSDEIHAARFVTKSHATSPGAFTSPTGPIGQVAESEAALWFRPLYSDFLGPVTAGQLPRVELITMVVGMGPAALQAVIATHPDGIVIEGFGGGHMPPSCSTALTRRPLREYRRSWRPAAATARRCATPTRSQAPRSTFRPAVPSWSARSQPSRPGCGSPSRSQPATRSKRPSPSTDSPAGHPARQGLPPWSLPRIAAQLTLRATGTRCWRDRQVCAIPTLVGRTEHPDRDPIPLARVPVPRTESLPASCRQAALESGPLRNVAGDHACDAQIPADMHAWQRRGVGPQSCTYLIDLCFSYRLTRSRDAAVCGGGAMRVTFRAAARKLDGRFTNEVGLVRRRRSAGCGERRIAGLQFEAAPHARFKGCRGVGTGDLPLLAADRFRRRQPAAARLRRSRRAGRRPCPGGLLLTTKRTEGLEGLSANRPRVRKAKLHTLQTLRRLRQPPSPIRPSPLVRRWGACRGWPSSSGGPASCLLVWT
jgi:hypothetical protein